MYEKDKALDTFKQRGYVGEDCSLDSDLIFAEILLGAHPCDGCNESREKCGGKPKKARRFGN